MTGIVQVGVGCFLFNSRFQLVTGVRKGSLGAGTIALPGGHLEFGESPEACAVREVLEETGIQIDENDVRFMTAVNTVFPAETKHYITLFVSCQVPDDSRPEVLEPEKCERWEWQSWEDLEKLAKTPDNDLFLPLQNLLRQRDINPRTFFSN
ncbi:nucleotide triphosphate diphosphatase NUDT15 [Rhodotorula paludigena]|uniref:nucleotide triphosphate diphosphatase NUDT15 n=1 Tax=Rhodotorula paludigena TaxID=86838 RepID=UPI003175811A